MKRIDVAVVSLVGLAALSGSAFAQCGGSHEAAAPAKAEHKVSMVAFVNQQADKDIVDTAVAAGSFKTLAAALQAAGLIDTLKGAGPFTVFAPTDEAFAKLPKGTVESLLKPENKAKLVSILTYHVVPGEVLAKDVRTGAAVTVNGQRIDLVAKDGKVTVDGARVTAADVKASNGVIHVIDSVILPSDQNVVQTAIKDGHFKTLATLIEKAGLVDALSGAGPFTVFAPTDEAFAKLPKETVDSLLKPEGKELLTKILTYHVVSGRV
ncbi:MAG: fasciclin domain-containing protein, partial [Phycisphaerales bacterium]